MATACEIILFHVDLSDHKADATDTVSVSEYSIL